MLRKLLILQAVLLLGLGSIFVLPRAYAMRESALFANLPSRVAEWAGQSAQIPDKVINELDQDTRFDQKYYYRPSAAEPGKFDLAKAFVVLSGNDMNNSIHRPERCFAAQGLTILESSLVEVDVGYNRPLKVRRLKSRSQAGHMNLTYYWFTGASKVTPSHYERTITDMLDRLVTGNNQSWAYVTVAADFDFEMGGRPANEAPRDEARTDEIIVDLIADLFEPTHRVAELRGWEKAE